MTHEDIDTGGRDRIREALRALLLNAGAPLLTFSILTRLGAPLLWALVAAAIFPAFAVAWSAVRTRRINAIGALSLTAIVIGVVGGVIFQNPHILLAKESIVTGLLGLVSLGSLIVARRPFVLVLARQFSSSAGRAAIDRLQAFPAFRARARQLTLIWAAALLADATARVALTFVLAPGVLLLVGPLMAIVTLGPLALWTAQTIRRWFTPLAAPVAV
jgi:hypothetical protein